MLNRILIALVSTALLGGCSSTGGPPSTKIGSAGGTVTDPGGGAVLAVPAGALSEERDISIAQTTDSPPSGLLAYSPLFRFQPEGLRFAKPVTVTLSFSAGTEVSVYWTKAGDSSFERLTSTVQGGKATASVDHFCVGFAGGAKIDQWDSGTQKDLPTKCGARACIGTGSTCSCQETCEGHVYKLDCPGNGTCTCLKDGASSGTASAVCSDQTSLRNAWNGCGFPNWAQPLDSGTQKDLPATCGLPPCGGVNNSCFCEQTCGGHAYKLDCPGTGTCTCLKDGASSGTASASCSSGITGLHPAWKACGFPGVP